MPPLFLLLVVTGVGLALVLTPKKLGKEKMTGQAGTTEIERLQGLQPQVRAALIRTRNRLSALGIRIFIGQTRRSLVEEQANLAKGASATMHSWHMLGRAVDVYPYGPDGKVDLAGKNIALFAKIHDEAAKEGFRGIAFNADGTRRLITVNKGAPNERKIWDGGHLEFPETMTFAQAAVKDGIKVV